VAGSGGPGEAAGAKKDVEPRLRQEPHPVQRQVDWRARCLRGAGFDGKSAARLARDTAFDLHALLELVDRGCPPALAVRIVAPLDREGYSA
jgi:hypothetical protein